MKKLLVLALSAVMVLALATVSMAAVTVSGEVVALYSFEGDAHDYAEGKIVFDGKVNDAVTAKLVYKYAQEGAADSELFVDEYWFNVAGDMGALKVGKWGYGTSGKKDILDGTFGDLKAEAALGYTYTADALTFKVWYTTDWSSQATMVDDNGFSAALAYDAETFGVELNYLNLGQYDATHDWSGFTANAWIKPMDALTAYVHVGNRDNSAVNVDVDVWIVGALFTGMDGALSLRGEVGNEDSSLTGDFDSWAIAAEYKAANGLAYKYTRKEVDEEIATSEFKVTCAF